MAADARSAETWVLVLGVGQVVDTQMEGDRAVETRRPVDLDVVQGVALRGIDPGGDSIAIGVPARPS